MYSTIYTSSCCCIQFKRRTRPWPQLELKLGLGTSYCLQLIKEELLRVGGR